MQNIHTATQQQPTPQPLRRKNKMTQPSVPIIHKKESVEIYKIMTV